MTTIVWDGWTLAADRQRTNGNTRERAIKLFDCGEYVYGATGGMHEAPVIARWLTQGAKWEERPEFEDNGTRGIVVRRKDAAVFIAGGKVIVLTQVPRGPTATGSGMDFALAAMACGKDARGAIALASRFDIGTSFGADAIDVRPRRRGR